MVPSRTVSMMRWMRRRVMSRTVVMRWWRRRMMSWTVVWRPVMWWWRTMSPRTMSSRAMVS